MLARLAIALSIAFLSCVGTSAASDKNTELQEALARIQDVIAKESARYAEAHAGSSQAASPAAETAAGRVERRAGHAVPAQESHEARHPILADSASATHEAVVEQDPMGIWEDLLKGNMRFTMGDPQARTLISSRQQLAYGQHPKVIVLTCSDSRVCPELIFDKSLGDLFVVRTAGNVADPVSLGSIEYAAEHLHARLLVVLGHEKCGAVAAAASGETMPSPNLEAIVSRIEPAIDKVRGRATGDELIHLGVEYNVHQSAQNVVTESRIVHELVTTGKLTLIKAVYDLKTGQVATLPETCPS